MTSNIKKFTDLVVWQEAHKLAVKVYELANNFPKQEKFGLVSQVQRAATSVPSNVAEGFKRGSSKEKIQFYRTAAGSLSELESQLILARDLKYFDQEKYKELAEKIGSVNRLLNAFIKSASKIPNTRYPIRNTSSGFTLIELLIVVALVSVSGLILVDLFIGQNRIYQTQTSELNVTNDARLALDEIDAYVRQANLALAAFGAYTGGPQVLVLQIQSVDSSSQLITGAYDHVVVYLSGANLIREVFPNALSSRASSIKKIASNVTGFNLTYDNANYALVSQVTTDLTIQQSAGIQTRSITVSSKAKLRN